MFGATAPRWHEVPRSDGRFLAGGLYPWPAAALPAPVAWNAVGADGRETLQPGRVARLAGGRGSRRHVVVAAVAIDAGHFALGVLRVPPLGALGAGVLLVAMEAGLGPRDRIARLETEDQPFLPALGFQVAAGRAVAALAGVAPVHVLGK